MTVPAARVNLRNSAPLRPEREYVLYWMIAARRTRFNFALEHAVAAAVRLDRGLVVLEALRCDYRYASDRLHRFVLDGMADNAARMTAAGVAYYSYVEPRAGAGKGLLRRLARNACLVVTDEFPCFFLPRMVDAAAAALEVRLEAVDGNGLLPLSDADRAFPTAYTFRRHLQWRLPVHVEQLPEPDPFASCTLRPVSIPPEITARWPSAARGLASLPIDHDVAPIENRRGGELAGSVLLSEFVDRKLARYAEERNEPDREATSGLSPYLHFGHVSPHQVFLAVATQQGWSPRDLASNSAGRREGWWGMSASAEAFLDQVVTWRELGYNGCAHGDDYETMTCLPAWAKRTLAEHAVDARPVIYGASELAEARTHDRLWNAAQAQLLREGRIHNYLRMLWGKKILEWTRSPEEALAIMVALNDRLALDGRDPNSYSGIAWVLGRYDRPWGPERPIFGTIRYMSSENTAKKMRLGGYLRRFGRPGID